ncbi:hypothetical protein PINS_up002075 [Pythium insidiosum]|nr:hypothetical protein PINS_up002075 [Pythium insidiosum]
MADEDLVIRRRLLTRTSTLGKSGIKKCADGLLSLFDSLANESMDPETCKQEVDSLLWEMEQLEFEANKVDILTYTSERELDAYAKLDAEIDSSVARVTLEIEELKAKVQVEKAIRAYKEEYESISRVVNELPSRKDIAADLAVEQRRLDEAESALQAVEDKLTVRTKQFSLLMHTIQNLKATLDEDMMMEEEEHAKRQDEDEPMDDSQQQQANESAQEDDV